jgi:hypothetical protein
MKVNVEVEMTPEEARRMMGLPDVSGLQQRMLEEMEARIRAGFESADPEAMMKAWTPGLQGFEQFQRFLWDSARKAASGGSEDAGTRKPSTKSQR